MWRVQKLSLNQSTGNPKPTRQIAPYQSLCQLASSAQPDAEARNKQVRNTIVIAHIAPQESPCHHSVSSPPSKRMSLTIAKTNTREFTDCALEAFLPAGFFCTT
jgi:hypothetical protein